MTFSIYFSQTDFDFKYKYQPLYSLVLINFRQMLHQQKRRNDPLDLMRKNILGLVACNEDLEQLLVECRVCRVDGQEERKRRTLNQFQKLSEESINQTDCDKIITVWKFRKQLEIWVQFFFDPDFRTINLTSYLTDNSIVWSLKTKYEICSALRILQNHASHYIQSSYEYQADLNPKTGIPYINSKFLLDQHKVDIAMSTQGFLENTRLALQGLLIISRQIFTKLVDLSSLNSTDSSEQSLKLQKPENKILVVLQGIISQGETNLLQDIQLVTKISEYSQFLDPTFLEISPNFHKIIDKIHSTDLLYPIQIQEKAQIISDAFSESEEPILQEENAILKKINILTNPKLIAWNYISEGGYGIIEKAFVQYQLSSYNNQQQSEPVILKGWIAKKTDLCDKSQKIKHQQHVLSRIGNEYYPYIMTYYISEQQQFEDSLFSKFQPHTSLDRYIAKNSETIRLTLILKFLEEAVKGLLFLSEQNFIHFDVKPNNIIISEKLIAKISDLGECLSSQFNEKPVILSYNCSYVRALTLPYAAPQILLPQNQWIFDEPYPSPVFQSSQKRRQIFENIVTQKIDVFSMGVTVFKTLFRSHLRGSKQNRKKSQIVFIPQVLDRYGFSRILKIIVKLVFNTLHKSPSERPNLFYIFLVLALSRKFLEELEKVDNLSWKL